jgi:glucose-1-phosphate adenylyltransferase
VEIKKSQHPEIMDKVASIVLAGGKGTRLYPLTESRCKPDVCFGGKYRLIDIPISNSLNADIHRIFVISQYFASSLNQHILETYPLDGFRKTKIEMLCPEETTSRKEFFKGTADAVRQNREHLESAAVDYYLILSGDQLYNINFTQMLAFAKKQDADLVIASIPVEEKEAKRMGLLRIDTEGKIHDFHEKPTEDAILKRFALTSDFLKGHHIVHPNETHYLGSMGIYIFKREALFKLLEEKGDDFGKDLIPLQIKKGRVCSYVYKGYWEDIGTIASYFEANLALTCRKNCLDTYDESNPIFTHTHHLPSPIVSNTIIHRSILSQGAIVDAKEITDSVIGIRIKIGEGTIVRHSVILGTLQDPPPSSKGTEYSIGKNCHIENTILDELATIGSDVQLVNKNNLKTFDSDGIFIRDGIIIVTSGTHVPDGYVL